MNQNFYDDRTPSHRRSPRQGVATVTAATITSMLLSGCLAITTDDSLVRVSGGEVTRTTNDGATQVLRGGDWISSSKPEAKIPRLPVWYNKLENSGIKAMRFGYESNENYRYIDPLSPIVSVNAFSANGWATYLVKGSDINDFQVRRIKLNQPNRPENLGRLQRIREEWRFTPIGGPTVAGNAYHLSSKGMLLWRNSTSFSYMYGPQAVTHLLPDGWRLAWQQKGDIETSRFLIATKSAPRVLDPGRYLMGFFDVDTGRLLPQTFEMSFVLGSENAQFENRFYLFETTQGPLTVTLENGVNQVVVRNVKTGAKRVAFDRSAGIARLKAEQTATGRILIEAAVGFKDEQIYDAEDFLYNGHRTPPSQ